MTTDQAGEAHEMRAYVHGLIMGSLMRISSGPKALLKQPVEVRQERDDQGNYLPYTDLVLASGIKLRVRVEVLLEED